MHNDLTNEKVQVYSDKQLPVDVDTIVSFVIQSGQVLEGGAICVSRHVRCIDVVRLLLTGFTVAQIDIVVVLL